MFNEELVMGKPVLKKQPNHMFDITGAIGLSGEAKGIVALSYPKVLALKITTLLLGVEVKIVGHELTDAIGELVNIVAGHAKQHLTEYKLQISLPNVVIGSNNFARVPLGVPTIAVPFKFSMGSFAMEVGLKS